jgi:alanine dehydrogenase
MRRNPKSKMETDLSGITEDTVFIIVTGHFGARAAQIVCQQSNSHVFVVDPDEKGLANLKDLRVKKILGDGILTAFEVNKEIVK